MQCRSSRGKSTGLPCCFYDSWYGTKTVLSTLGRTTELEDENDRHSKQVVKAFPAVCPFAGESLFLTFGLCGQCARGRLPEPSRGQACHVLRSACAGRPEQDRRRQNHHQDGHGAARRTRGHTAGSLARLSPALTLQAICRSSTGPSDSCRARRAVKASNAPAAACRP